MSLRFLLAMVLAVSGLQAASATLHTTALAYNLSGTNPWMPLFWGGFNALAVEGQGVLEVRLPGSAMFGDRLTIRAGGELGFNSDGSSILLSGRQFNWSGPVQGPDAKLWVEMDASSTTADIEAILIRVFYACLEAPGSTTAQRVIDVRWGPTLASTSSLATLVVTPGVANVPAQAQFAILRAAKEEPAALRIVEAWDDVLSASSISYGAGDTASAGSFARISGGVRTVIAAGDGITYSDITAGLIYFVIASGASDTLPLYSVRLEVRDGGASVSEYPVPTEVLDITSQFEVVGPLHLILDFSGAVTAPTGSQSVQLQSNDATATSQIQAYPLPGVDFSASGITCAPVTSPPSYVVTLDLGQVWTQWQVARPSYIGWTVVLTRTKNSQESVVRLPMLVAIIWPDPG